MIETKLTMKPCPFCGGQPEIAKHFKEDIWRFIHRCPVMGPLMLDWRDSSEALIKTWNTRKP